MTAKRNTCMHEMNRKPAKQPWTDSQEVCEMKAVLAMLITTCIKNILNKNKMLSPTNNFPRSPQVMCLA